MKKKIFGARTHALGPFLKTVERPLSTTFRIPFDSKDTLSGPFRLPFDHLSGPFRVPFDSLSTPFRPPLPRHNDSFLCFAFVCMPYYSPVSAVLPCSCGQSSLRGNGFLVWTLVAAPWALLVCVPMTSHWNIRGYVITHYVYAFDKESMLFSIVR